MEVILLLMSGIQQHYCFWNHQPIVIAAYKQRLLQIWLNATTAKGLGLCNVLQQIRHLAAPSPPLGLSFDKNANRFTI